jgi:hypothetical protein
MNVMSAARRRKPPVFTPTRVALGLLFTVMALSLALPGVAETWWVLSYLGLIVATAIALNGLRREPGQVLGRRAVRRGLVLALMVVCVGLVATPPFSGGQGPSAFLLLFFLLIPLNVALGRATQRVATAPDAFVDEREEALRNRAHRIAYPLFAVVCGGTLVAADMASTQTRMWVIDALIHGGASVAFLELLFVLPAMVFAFLEPDRLRPDPVDTDLSRLQRGRARAAAALLGLTLGTPVLLSLLLLLPPRVTAFTSAFTASPPAQVGTSAVAPMNCKAFNADVVVGRGILASIPVSAAACWNGRVATESYGMNRSDCHAGDTLAAYVTTLRCSHTTDSGGTLHFVYSATVASALLPFLTQDVTVHIVIDRNGNVEQFP